MDVDALLQELQEFQKKTKKEKCPLLEQFILHVAKTGQTMISWLHFKTYFMFKLEEVMEEFHASSPEQRVQHNPNMEHVSFEEMKKRILNMVDGFDGIPFTIQRLCELLTDPRRHYTETDKFLRGIEKNVTVVSCVCPTMDLSTTKGVLLPGNTPFYAYNRNMDLQSVLKLPKRTPISLSKSINGLPDRSVYKDIEHGDEVLADQDKSSGSTLSAILLNKRMKNKQHEEEGCDSQPSENKRVKIDEKHSDVSKNAEMHLSFCNQSDASSASSDSLKKSCVQEMEDNTETTVHPSDEDSNATLHQSVQDTVESAPSEKGKSSEEQDTEKPLKDNLVPSSGNSSVVSKEGAAALSESG